MSQTLIRDALDAKLLTYTRGGDIVVEGQVYQPLQTTPYIFSRLSAYTRSGLGVGPSAPKGENGIYQITVARPTREGTRPASRTADELVKLFDRGTQLVLANGQVLTIENASAQPAQEAANWLTLPVLISWICLEP